jgi:RNA polymerase sigma-70 factor (ECF subfamily)
MVTGRPETAEDAAQDTLLRAVRHRPQLTALQSEWAWLRVIAVRRALTHLKRQKFWTELDEFQPGKPDGSDERLAVEHTLCRLKPDHRLILGLAVGEGMTQAEIAVALAIPEGTVASRLHAARHAFRKIWEEE